MFCISGAALQCQILRDQNEESPLQSGMSLLFSVGVEVTLARWTARFSPDLSHFVLSSLYSDSFILPICICLKTFLQYVQYLCGFVAFPPSVPEIVDFASHICEGFSSILEYNWSKLQLICSNSHTFHINLTLFMLHNVNSSDRSLWFLKVNVKTGKNCKGTVKLKWDQ